MKQKPHKATLTSLGERRILEELILPRFPEVAIPGLAGGDDCAVLSCPGPGRLLVVTTDPCPTPVICLLEQPDYYHYGRLTALINVSDLAAMGAEPLGLWVSTDMPESMLVSEYERFLDGLRDATDEWRCPVRGGNIKDGPAFAVTGTAIGTALPEQVLRRVGARPGDLVCVVGEMGLFWAAVVAHGLAGLQIPSDFREPLERALYRPVARLDEGVGLGRMSIPSACMDSSDGVTGCLYELAAINQADIVVDAASLTPHPAVDWVAANAGVDARKLMLSWGDWQLVCTIAPERLSEAKGLLAELGTPFRAIGEVRPGSGNVWLQEGSGESPLNNLSSKRFHRSSFFTHGLEAYREWMFEAPLTTSRPAERRR